MAGELAAAPDVMTMEEIADYCVMGEFATTV